MGLHSVQQSGTSAAVAAVNTFTGINTFRTRVFIRADDTASPSSAAAINLKPAGDGTAGAWQGYHADSIGYIIHFTDSSSMTGDGLIGLGVQHGNAGLVLGLHGPGKGISGQTDAGDTAYLMYGAHFGNNDLVRLLHAQTGTPGTLLTLRGWALAPAATRIISIQDTSGAELGYWNHDGLLHLVSPTLLHEVTFTTGSGGVVKLYADSGSGGGNVSVFTSYIQQSTNRLLLRSSAAASVKGSESMNTLLELTNGNSIALFGGTARTQPARAGQLTDSSGGTSGGSTIAAIAASTNDADAPKLADTKNAIATLAAKINVIEGKLSAAGTGIGVTA